MRVGVVLLSVAAVMSSLAAGGLPLTVSDPSFEDAQVSFVDQYTYVGLPSSAWSSVGSVGVFLNDPPALFGGKFINNADKHQVAYIVSTGGELFQQLTPGPGQSYQPGGPYILSAGIARSAQGTIPDGATIRLELGYGNDASFTAIPGAFVDVVKNGSNLSTSELAYFSTAPLVVAPGASFVGQTVSLRISTRNGSSSTLFDVDNVSVVPEPAGLSLLAVASLALVRRRR